MTKEQYNTISSLTSVLLLALDSNTLTGTKNHPLQADMDHLKNMMSPEDFQNVCVLLRGIGFKFD